MFDVSLSYILLTRVGIIFLGAISFLCLCECWTEIPGVNEPNTYGGKNEKEKNIMHLILLSNSIHKK